MKRRNPANKLDDEAVQNDDRVKWNSDAGEDANPLSGIEPSKGLEAVPDITKGEKLSAITFV